MRAGQPEVSAQFFRILTVLIFSLTGNGQSFNDLFMDNPIIFFHTILALMAILLGTGILLRPKGTYIHKTMGWV